MMDQKVTDIFSHVLQLGTRQRWVINYHTQASLLSEKGNQSCNRCDWFLDTVNCLRLKNPPCFSEWICLYLKEKGDRERTTLGGGALSLCHWDQWQKPALSNGSSKIGTPSPLEDGDRSILQNVVGLLAQAMKNVQKIRHNHYQTLLSESFCCNYSRSGHDKQQTRLLL